MSDKEAPDESPGCITVLVLLVLEVAAFLGGMAVNHAYGYDFLAGFDWIARNDPDHVASAAVAGVLAMIVVDILGAVVTGFSWLAVVLVFAVAYLIMPFIIFVCGAIIFGVIWLFLPEAPSSDTMTGVITASVFGGIIAYGLLRWRFSKYLKDFDPPTFL